jgi:hypothetical protein
MTSGVGVSIQLFGKLIRLSRSLIFFETSPQRQAFMGLRLLTVKFR